MRRKQSMVYNKLEVICKFKVKSCKFDINTPFCSMIQWLWLTRPASLLIIVVNGSD